MVQKHKKRAFSVVTLREVEKEMAKPRVAESVKREDAVDPEPRESGKRRALRS
jgi:hypothetical protein